MEKECSIGLMEVNLKGCSRTTASMDMALIYGQTTGSIRDNGKTTK